MAITPEQIEEALKELGILAQREGRNFVHTTQGSFAPEVHTLLTLDDDGESATIVAALEEGVPAEKRTVVYELMNLAHGQSLWNVRFHLDGAGQVFAVGKFVLWDAAFNMNQFSDVMFSLIVSADRLYPCIVAIIDQGRTAEEAFELFFVQDDEEDQDPSPESVN